MKCDKHTGARVMEKKNREKNFYFASYVKYKRNIMINERKRRF